MIRSYEYSQLDRLMRQVCEYHQRKLQPLRTLVIPKPISIQDCPGREGEFIANSNDNAVDAHNQTRIIMITTIKRLDAHNPRAALNWAVGAGVVVSCSCKVPHAMRSPAPWELCTITVRPTRELIANPVVTGVAAVDVEIPPVELYLTSTQGSVLKRSLL